MQITQGRPELVFEEGNVKLCFQSYDFRNRCSLAVIRMDQDSETFIVKEQEVARVTLSPEDMRALHHLIGVAVRRMES